MNAKETLENILTNHNHKIIFDGYFGKKNKTVEEKVRCFLISKKIINNKNIFNILF